MPGVIWVTGAGLRGDGSQTTQATVWYLMFYVKVLQPDTYQLRVEVLNPGWGAVDEWTRAPPDRRVRASIHGTVALARLY